MEYGSLYHESLYFFQEAIGRSAVPVFFVISGYMFFYKVENLTKDIYKSKLKRRVTSLLVPYLFWNSLALIEGCIKHLPALAGLFPNIGNQPIDFFYCIKSFWCTPDGTCPIYYPFWYIRDLMVCALFTPHHIFIRKEDKAIMAVTPILRNALENQNDAGAWFRFAVLFLHRLLLVDLAD